MQRAIHNLRGYSLCNSPSEASGCRTQTMSSETRAQNPAGEKVSGEVAHLELKSTLANKFIICSGGVSFFPFIFLSLK